MKTTKSAKTKERILKAAARAFGKTGYWNTEMDTVARSARVAKGTLYLHFESKEVLFLAVMEQVLEDLARRMMRDDSHLPVPERIRNKVGVYLSFFEEHFSYFHAVTEEHSGLTRRTAEIFWRKLMEKCGSIEEDIRRDVADRRIKDIPPADLIFLLIGMMHGAIHQWFLSGRTYSLAGKADGIADIFYRGIRSER